MTLHPNRRLPDAGALADFTTDLAALMGPEHPVEPAFRGDLLRLAMQWTLRNKRNAADPRHPLQEILYVERGGLYTYVRHSRSGIHAGKRVVVDLHPKGSFLFPLGIGATTRHPLHTEAVGDTELLSITVNGFLDLSAEYPQAIELLRQHSRWREERHLAMHSGLAYTDAMGKLRWMKATYAYFYRHLPNQCVGSFLGLDVDTVRKNRY